MQVQTDARRPRRQDTFDLRDQIHPDGSIDTSGHAHYYIQQRQHHNQQLQQGMGIASDSEHSVMEDSSDADGEMDVSMSGTSTIIVDREREHAERMEHIHGAENDHDLELVNSLMREVDGDVDMDEHESDDALDDGDYASDTTSLSVPNDSIDFDMVYSLTNFAATVEGQASVVKGDILFLMDDSNSYWWLVRVLKTQEVGYIPAENIETPFERLARLNRHRNVDVRTILLFIRIIDFTYYLSTRNQLTISFSSQRRQIMTRTTLIPQDLNLRDTANASR